MKLLKKFCHTIAILLLALIVIEQVVASFPIPKIPDWPEEDRPQQQQGGQQAQQPPDKCSKNLCKGRICEVICRNNPAEGGKYCNCDNTRSEAAGRTLATAID